MCARVFDELETIALLQGHVDDDGVRFELPNQRLRFARGFGFAANF